MPVVEKVYKDARWNEDLKSFGYADVINNAILQEIRGVYKNVIDFIIWHNANQTQHP